MKLGAETDETVLDSKAVISADDRSCGVTCHLRRDTIIQTPFH